MEAYSSIGHDTALYGESNVTFCLPHLLEERVVIALDSCCIVNVFVVRHSSEFRIENETQYIGMYAHVWYSVVDLQVESST